jgi:orotate phosphoribosyltransferase
MPAALDANRNSAAGLETARLLLEIKAVNFRPAEPYTLTAGWASPVYIDCRRVISFPAARARITALAVELLEREVGFDNVDAIAGGETAGIPYAAWIADAVKKPMLYVRKQPKGFGRDAQIEGSPQPGSRALLVEDLATDGGSKLVFIDGMRKAGLKVTDVFVVFFYGAFSNALDTLKAAGVRLHWLATWQDVLTAAEDGRHFDKAAIAGVREFLADPAGWSQAHGGKGAD